MRYYSSQHRQQLVSRQYLRLRHRSLMMNSVFIPIGRGPSQLSVSVGQASKQALVLMRLISA